MKKINNMSVLFLILIFTFSVGIVSSSDIFPYKVNKVVLDNGFTIISIPFDSPGLIAYTTAVRTGARNEVEPGKSGFAHFFEHMMFRGTEKYPAEKREKILKKLGVDANAFTSDDWTFYHMVVSSSAIETVMDIESDRFINLKYSEDVFKTEAGAVDGEYNKNSSSPFFIIYQKLRETAFTTHTYKHTAMGFPQDIKDMPNQYKYSLDFFDRYYRPENCFLIIVGDFDQKKLIELSKKYYSSWKRRDYKVEIPSEPPQKEERTIHIPWKNKTRPYLAMVYHIPAFSDKDIEIAALDVFADLTLSQSSPLYQKLVIEKQYAEFISGGAAFNRDPSLFYIYTRIKDKALIDTVKNEIYSAIEQMKTKPVTSEKLADVKSNLKYSFAMSLSEPYSVARTIGEFLQLSGGHNAVNNLYKMYDKVTAQDVINVAKKYFYKENRTVVTLMEEEK